MHQTTITTLSVLVFALVIVSFVIRGVGQFVVGPRTAMLVAGPVAVAAAALLVVIVVVWFLAWAGITTIEQNETDP